MILIYINALGFDTTGQLQEFQFYFFIKAWQCGLFALSISQKQLWSFSKRINPFIIMVYR